MTTLTVTEFNRFGVDLDGHAVVGDAPRMPPLAEQQVAIGGASTQSSAFSQQTVLILVHTDTACSLAFGPNPTAITGNHRMAANETRIYGVNPGDKIAVIT